MNEYYFNILIVKRKSNISLTVVHLEKKTPYKNAVAMNLSKSKNFFVIFSGFLVLITTTPLCCITKDYGLYYENLGDFNMYQ